jgi:acetate---CoA ligase (ADP-forming)
MTLTHDRSTENGGNPPSRQAGLASLFGARSLAVVGASASAEKAGGAMFAAVSAFPGPVYPINPGAREIGGRTCYARVQDVPEPVDLAVIVVPPAAVAAVLEDCGQAGVGAAVICAGGFAESGPEGAALQDEIGEVARRHGIRLLGPNTSGFLVPRAQLYPTFMPGVEELPPGGLAIVAQSGGVNLATSFLAAAAGAGISLAVGLGNAVDVGFADVLDHLATDDDTRAVALHIEGVADGRALMDAIRRVTATKPVVAFKVGRSDVGDFARSHTGALAGDCALARAALAQAGAVVVDSLTDLVEASAALSVARVRSVADPGVGIVTGQAGPGLILADALTTAGVRLPELSAPTTTRIGQLLPPLTYQRNPVDTGRPGPTFSDVLRAVAEDPGVDALMVYALQEGGTADVVADLAARSAQGALPATVMVTDGSADAVAEQHAQLLQAGVWTAKAPDRGAFAMSALVTDARARARRASDGHGPTSVEPAAPLGEVGALDEDAGKAVLESLGIPTPPRRACSDPESAMAAFQELPKPVVVKILDAAVTHKSAAGGVRLGVTTAEEMTAALTETARAAAPGAEPRWLVEAQAPSGIEIIVGGIRDASFGPAVLVGAGGTGVEWGPAPVLAMAPLTHLQAAAAVRALPQALLAALGDEAVEALVSVLVEVAGFLAAHPEIRELDINPIRATASGLIALDAVFVLDDTPGPADVAASPRAHHPHEEIHS